jgi:LysR family cyn operon transcriptional activator
LLAFFGLFRPEQKWRISIELIDAVYGTSLTAKPGEQAEMELRHLRYFFALAEELNFTRAAGKVHVTQSTLSHQIKQLENEIGQPLFEREGRRVVMTGAGESLLLRLGNVLHTIDDSVRAARGVATKLTGTLHVGTTPTFNASLMPVCLASFLQRQAAVQVIVTERLAEFVEVEIAEGHIDVGIGYMPTRRNDLSFEPLYIEEMVLVVPPGHPFATRRRIRLAELHHQPLILNTRQSATRLMLDERLASVNAEPIIVAEVDAIQPTLDLVARGPYGAIVSEHVVSNARDICVVPLEDPTPLRTPGILWKTEIQGSNACRSFVALVRQTIARRKMKAPARARGREASL